MKPTGLNLISLVICILGVYIGMKAYTVNHHNYIEKRIRIIESQVEYSAKRCYIESHCNNTVTIGDLYTKGYIKKQIVNPRSGNSIDLNTSINYINKKVIIDWAEFENTTK